MICPISIWHGAFPLITTSSSGERLLYSSRSQQKHPHRHHFNNHRLYRERERERERKSKFKIERKEREINKLYRLYKARFNTKRDLIGISHSTRQKN